MNIALCRLGKSLLYVLAWVTPEMTSDGGEKRVYKQKIHRRNASSIASFPPLFVILIMGTCRQCYVQ